MNLSDLPPLPSAETVLVRGRGVSVRPLSIAEMDTLAALYLEPQPPLEKRPGGEVVRKVNHPEYARDLRRHGERLMLLEVALAINYASDRHPVPGAAPVRLDDECLGPWRAWAAAAAAELAGNLTWDEVERLHKAMKRLCDLDRAVEDAEKK